MTRTANKWLKGVRQASAKNTPLASLLQQAGSEEEAVALLQNEMTVKMHGQGSRQETFWNDKKGPGGKGWVGFEMVALRVLPGLLQKRGEDSSDGDSCDEERRARRRAHSQPPARREFATEALLVAELQDVAIDRARALAALKADLYESIREGAAREREGGGRGRRGRRERRRSLSCDGRGGRHARHEVEVDERSGRGGRSDEDTDDGEEISEVSGEASGDGDPVSGVVAPADALRLFTAHHVSRLAWRR